MNLIILFTLTIFGFISIMLFGIYEGEKRVKQILGEDLMNLHNSKVKTLKLPLNWKVGLDNDDDCLLFPSCSRCYANETHVKDGAHYNNDKDKPCRLVFDEFNKCRGRLADNTLTPRYIPNEDISSFKDSKQANNDSYIKLLPWYEFQMVHLAHNLDNNEFEMSYCLVRAMTIDDEATWALLGSAIVSHDNRHFLSYVPDIEAVLKYEIQKHKADSCKTLLEKESLVEHYKQECIRYIKAIYDGEQYNSESKLSNSTHALTCVLLILYSKVEKTKNELP